MTVARGKAAVSTLLLVAGIVLLAVAIVWIRAALQPPRGAEPAALPAAGAGKIDQTPVIVATATTAAPVTAANSADATAFRERLVRSGIAQQFSDPSLPAEAVALLAAGQVAAVERLLQSMSSAEAAVLESRLMALCESTAGSNGDTSELVSTATGSDAAEQLTNESYRAQREWAARLRTGCTPVRFDAAGIRQRLATSAAAGHAASLWEIAVRSDGEERTRKTLSAALLGSAAAQLRLANGVTGNLTATTAIRLSPNDRLAWLKSAAVSSVPAQLQYARCLASGCEGIPLEPDPAASKAWYERAARGGSPAAIAALASGTDGNSSVTVSDVERYAWSQVGQALSTSGCLGFDTSLYAGPLASASDVAQRALRPSDQPEASALTQQLRTALPCKP